MLRLIKQVFIALLSFGVSLATEDVYVIDKPFMTGPTLIDLSPVDLNYYLFMIGLDKYNVGCNTVDNLSMKICVPTETKDLNVKVFDKITRVNEVKHMVKHISSDCKCKLNSITCNSNQKWNYDKSHSFSWYLIHFVSLVIIYLLLLVLISIRCYYYYTK